MSVRKSKWAKSTNGPDWTDVEMMIRSLNALHSGEAGLTILARGIGSSGGISVAASIMFNVLPGSSLPPCVSVVKDWPCTSHAELAAHSFALLHELDYEISKVYKQESLWK
jgi:hypothetical protein